MYPKKFIIVNKKGYKKANQYTINIPQYIFITCKNSNAGIISSNILVSSQNRST